MTPSLPLHCTWTSSAVTGVGEEAACNEEAGDAGNVGGRGCRVRAGSVSGTGEGLLGKIEFNSMTSSAKKTEARMDSPPKSGLTE
jgi:hypothetical protein